MRAPRPGRDSAHASIVSGSHPKFRPVCASAGGKYPRRSYDLTVSSDSPRRSAISPLLRYRIISVISPCVPNLAGDDQCRHRCPRDTPDRCTRRSEVVGQQSDRSHREERQRARPPVQITLHGFSVSLSCLVAANPREREDGPVGPGVLQTPPALLGHFRRCRGLRFSRFSLHSRNRCSTSLHPSSKATTMLTAK